MTDTASHGTVPVPNALFDGLLPKLSEAELKVLLTIVRATRGWREGNELGGWQYKRRDWLTNSQLTRRTGCASSSVSRAINTLALAGLIRVESVTGEVLDSPEKRRRNIGRLYFGLGDMWITPPPADNAAARTTTNTPDNKKGTAPTHRHRPLAAPARTPGGPVRIAELLQKRRSVR